MSFLRFAPLLVVASCAEPEPIFHLELSIGFEDAVEFDLFGVLLTDEPAPCNASGGLEVERTADNTPVEQLNFSERTGIEIDVTEGRYAFFVEGYDIEEVKTAQGCAETTLRAGQTKTLPITMLPFAAEAVCGDGIRTAFEQCDDGGTADGDGCDGSCVAEEQQANRRTVGLQRQPSIGVGVPFVLGFRSGNGINSVGFRPDGSLRADPWGGDQEIDAPSPDGIDECAIGVGGTRFVAAYVEIENLGVGGVESDIRATTMEWSEEEDTEQEVGIEVHPPDDGVEQEAPSVAVQDDGSYAIGWIADAEVFVMTFDDAGAPIGGPTSLATGANGVSLGALSDGNFVAAWDRGAAEAQLFDADAVPGTEVSAGTAAGDVALGTSFQRDEFALVWIEDDDVYFQAFGSDGAAVGTDALPMNEGGTNSAPAVSGHAGHWFVVWGDGGDIKGHYVASSGSFVVGPMAVGAGGPTDEAFTVNQQTDGVQSAPVVAMNGELAIAAWADGADRPDDTDGGIRMRFLTEPAE